MALFAGFAVCAGVAGAAQLDGNFDALSCHLLVLSNFYHDGALHTFSLEFASDFIIAFDISLEMECICRTSATTVETCEAVFAVFLCVNVASAEFLLEFRLCDAFVYISHEILFFTNKLVTWVKITPGCYSQVLCS